MAKKRNPIVAIVGRPNVGKSTLFNAIAGEKISIVEDTPGVTRDRIYSDCSWLNHDFTLIDTGGIEPDTGDIILAKMREQAEIAIEMADVIIFLVDVKSGVQDADQKVCEMLRRSGKPIVLTVNKVDKPTAQIADVYEFYNLGIGDPFPVSSVNKMGLGDLLEEVAKHFPEGDSADVEDDAVRVAIIGKPNVGKSSITTRDAIDTRVKHDGREYVFIDTAGLRRRNKITEDLERYMIIRAVAAVDRADIALLVINAQEGVTEQDAKIAGIAHDKGKAVIVAVNKWDAVEKDNSTMKKFTDKIHQILSFIPYAEIIYISALTGQRMNKIYDEVDLVHANQSMRIQTGVLNEIITEAAVMQQPPQDKGKMLKIYYATQSGVKPPTFVLFVNYRYLMHFSYQRYIENQIRETFGFRGTPLRFIIRERNEDK